MRKLFVFFVILIPVLFQGCTKKDSTDLTQLTLGSKNIGNFIPVTQTAYKRPEGYIIQLSSDTITITMLLPELKPGDYSITNVDQTNGEAYLNIDFSSSSFSAASGSVSVTDTGSNSISGVYSVSSTTSESGDQLKISNGKFTKVLITSMSYGSVEDYEHNQYKTIIIGSQTWMAENLRSRIYSDGDSIKEVFNYGGNESLKNIYGLYYFWNSATRNTKIEMTQGACPVGWHLPSNAEWIELLNIMGGESVAGGKLKSMVSWNFRNAGADNYSGFSALGAGMHYPLVEYPDLSERMGMQSFFWSSSFDTTKNGLSSAWSVALFNTARSALRSPYMRTDLGFSVRCLKN